MRADIVTEGRAISVGSGPLPDPQPIAPPSAAATSPALAARDRLYLALLAILWLVAILLIDPVGEFPVNDDWAYAESVVALVDHGRLSFSDWNAANLLSHVAWGSAFALVLGTGNTALRISTLVAAFVATVALYQLLRLNRATPAVALLGSLLFLFNPLTLALAFSFMTDVTYTAFQMVALYCIAAGSVERSRPWLILGWGMAIAALLCRQVGIAIAMGAATAMLARGGAPSPKRVAVALVPVVAFVMVQVAYQGWLRWAGLLPLLFGRQTDGIFARSVADPAGMAALVASWPLLALVYFGVFLLPLAIACVPALGTLYAKRWRWQLGATVVVVAVWMLTRLAGIGFPPPSTTLRVTGLGSDLLGAWSPNWFITACKICAIAGGALVCMILAGQVGRAARGWRTSSGFSITVFVGVTALAQLVATMPVEIRFDRYLIPMIPCVIVVLAAALRDVTPSRRALGAAFASAAAMVVLVTLAGHDMMAAKRVDWAVYRGLTRRISPTHVDAGFPLNAKTGFGRFGDKVHVAHWYEIAEYLVTTGTTPAPGYRIVARYPVDRWLPWDRSGAPVVVERMDPAGR